VGTLEAAAIAADLAAVAAAAKAASLAALDLFFFDFPFGI